MIHIVPGCYPSFGWTVDERMKNEAVTLKRDRKIINKVELTRLQRHFEACIEELDQLERSKTTTATNVDFPLVMIVTTLAMVFGVGGAHRGRGVWGDVAAPGPAGNAAGLTAGLIKIPSLKKRRNFFFLIFCKQFISIQTTKGEYDMPVNKRQADPVNVLKGVPHMNGTSKGFVGYEYMEAPVQRSMEALYADGYQNFGWQLEGTSEPKERPGQVDLKFKRDKTVRVTPTIDQKQDEIYSVCEQASRLLQT